MRREFSVLLALFICFGVSLPVLASAVQRGDEAWQRRAEGFLETGKLNKGPIDAAIAAYEEALVSEPENLEVYFKLMNALYFKGYFVSENRKEKKRLADRGIELTESALAIVARRGAGGTAQLNELNDEERVERLSKVPDAVGAYFWASVNWGIWAMAHGNLDAARRNVATKIRDDAQMVIWLDDRYWDGGGYRLLGRLHTDTPKVPLFTPWIDRHYGIELLRKANAISTRDPRNPLFLAEGLLRFEPEHEQEALALLRDLVSRTPDSEHPVQDRYYIDEARRVLDAHTEQISGENK